MRWVPAGVGGVARRGVGCLPVGWGGVGWPWVWVRVVAAGASGAGRCRGSSQPARWHAAGCHAPPPALSPILVLPARDSCLHATRARPHLCPPPTRAPLRPHPTTHTHPPRPTPACSRSSRLWTRSTPTCTPAASPSWSTTAHTPHASAPASGPPGTHPPDGSPAPRLRAPLACSSFQRWGGGHGGGHARSLGARAGSPRLPLASRRSPSCHSSMFGVKWPAITVSPPTSLPSHPPQL